MFAKTEVLKGFCQRIMYWKKIHFISTEVWSKCYMGSSMGHLDPWTSQAKALHNWDWRKSEICVTRVAYVNRTGFVLQKMLGLFLILMFVQPHQPHTGLTKSLNSEAGGENNAHVYQWCVVCYCN